MDAAQIHRQIPFALDRFDLPALGQLYRGKVRDTYRKADRLVIVTTDRISAFDHVLGTLPFKGEVLNRTAAFWFEKTRDVAPNHVIDVPDANVMVVRACRALPVEMVVRGYLTGSLWRDYQQGVGAAAYGIELEPGLRKDQRFDAPIITPTTKAEVGAHDQPISLEQIAARGLVEKRVLDEACERALALFRRGQEWAKTRGLILVDTKYEFGLDGDELLLIDEVHTMDSSRYWEADSYAARFERGEDQKMLDKENVRQWLIRERGFSGQGKPPPLPDEVRADASRIYIGAFERITGQTFDSAPGDPRPRIERALRDKGLV